MEPKNQKNHSLLNDDGKPMCEQEIKVASETWSHEQWELYLRSFEIDKDQNEVGFDFDEESEPIAENVFELAPESASDEIIDLLGKYISHLTDKQKFLIEKYFFEGRSERQIARMMLISRSGVVDLKKRALRQIENKAKDALSKITISKEQGSENENLQAVRESREKGALSC